MRTTYELEDAPEGTRVTEYSVPAPGFLQRTAFAMTRLELVVQVVPRQRRPPTPHAVRRYSTTDNR